jgi:hypothetical protein
MIEDNEIFWHLPAASSYLASIPAKYSGKSWRFAA